MLSSARLVPRQAVLAVAVAAMLATAGCTGVVPGSDSGSASGAQLDNVPADATFVGHVDVSGMADDESLRAIVNTALEANAEMETYDGPTSVEEMLAETENESGLDPTKVNGMTIFGTEAEASIESASSSGAIVASSYSESEMVAAIEDSDDVTLTEQTYEETTLYADETGEYAVGVLGDGTFAVGSQAVVQTVIDVRAGNVDAVSGDLVTTFENTDDDYVRMAMEVPQSEVPTEQYEGATSFNVSAFNTVEYVSMTFGTGDDSVETTVNMVTTSESDAERTYEVIDGALSLYAGMGSEEASELLDAVSVEQNGDTVSVTYTDSVEDIQEWVERLYGMQMGVSASGSASSSDTSDADSGAVTPVTA
jgi:hypothetical protein